LRRRRSTWGDQRAIVVLSDGGGGDVNHPRGVSRRSGTVVVHGGPSGEGHHADPRTLVDRGRLSWLHCFGLAEGRLTIYVIPPHQSSGALSGLCHRHPKAMWVKAESHGSNTDLPGPIELVHV
jgi:hypothetical protein